MSDVLQATPEGPLVLDESIELPDMTAFALCAAIPDMNRGRFREFILHTTCKAMRKGGIPPTWIEIKIGTHEKPSSRVCMGHQGLS